MPRGPWGVRMYPGKNHCLQASCPIPLRPLPSGQEGGLQGPWTPGVAVGTRGRGLEEHHPCLRGPGAVPGN